MATIFYRSFGCFCALVSLAACSRASYQFAASAAYLPASTTVTLPPAAALGEAPRAVCSTHNTLITASYTEPDGSKVVRSTRATPPIRKPSGLVPSHIQLSHSRLNSQLLTTKKSLIAAHASSRNTAGSGPYFSGSDFGAILALLALYALLLSLLITGAVLLLVKLIMHLTRGKARSRATSPATLPTGP